MLVSCPSTHAAAAGAGFEATRRRPDDRPDPQSGQCRGDQQGTAQRRPPGPRDLAAGRARTRRRADPGLRRDAHAVRRRGHRRPRERDGFPRALRARGAGADRARECSTRTRSPRRSRSAPRTRSRSTNVKRLQLVRRPRAAHLPPRPRAVARRSTSAREYKQQLQHIVEGSTDAIAQVQEGIIVDANPAWLELFGYTNPEEVVGTPLMDAFDADDHAAIKGALVACLQGKWSGHTLHASALLVSGHTPSLEFQLRRAEFDGEPCVQVVVPAQGRRRRRVRAPLDGRDAERPGDRLPAPPLLHRAGCASASRSRRRAASAAWPTSSPTSTKALLEERRHA